MRPGEEVTVEGAPGGEIIVKRFETVKDPLTVLIGKRPLFRKPLGSEKLEELSEEPAVSERSAKSLKMVQEGRWSIRRAASFAGLKYHEILDKMAEMGVDSGPTLKELREPLIVTDSSPLIHLSKIGKLRLLKRLYGTVLIFASAATPASK